MCSSDYYHKLINFPTSERYQSASLIVNIYTDCYNTCSSGVLHFSLIQITIEYSHPGILLKQQSSKRTQLTRRKHDIKTFHYIKTD